MPQPASNDTDVKIANAALAMFGAPAIFGFDEETALARKVNAVYLDTVEACLTAYGWSFAKRARPLEVLAEVPQTGYARAFALPPGRIGATLVVRSNRTSPAPYRDFTIHGDALHANALELFADYVIRPEVALWPPAFRAFARTALAADLCVPVSHDTKFAEELKTAAWGSEAQGRRGGLFLKAMEADLRTHPGPQPLYASDPFTDAWTSPGTVSISD